MKKAVKLLLILTIVSFIAPVHAQDAKQKGLDAITQQAVKGQLEFLASDWTEGRATGTQGAYMAADYIAADCLAAHLAEDLAVTYLVVDLAVDCLMADYMAAVFLFSCCSKLI